MNLMRWCGVVGFGFLIASVAARADEAELSRKVDNLAREVERLKAGQSATQEPSEHEGAHVPPAVGLEGSAAKVYRVRRGPTIGGFGEMLYENFKTRRDDGNPAGPTKIDRFDFLRNSLYFGYRYNEYFLFNSEIELFHGKTSGSGELSLQFAYIDYLMMPIFNFRAGMVLIPMGLINEGHEPGDFFGARRPEVETRILPSTWHENGAGFFGQAGPLVYRTYLISGLNASKFSAEGLSEGRQDGSLSKVQKGWGYTLRADFVGYPGLLAGGSMYYGQSGTYTGTGQGLGTPDSIRTNIWELHSDFKYRGFDFRALAAWSVLDRVVDLNSLRGLSGADAIGEKQWGYYAQLGFDVMSLVPGFVSTFTPFIRWERYNTQAKVPDTIGLSDPSHQAEVWDFGFVYKPIEQIAVKVDYENFAVKDQSGVDQWNIGLGFNY